MKVAAVLRRMPFAKSKLRPTQEKVIHGPKVLVKYT